MAKDERYGNGNPPYSLYQGKAGLWGLVDKDGKKLTAVFKRNDDRFSCVPWEVVTFNSEEGFDLLAWYDPCEVWFNFTFDDPHYPDEYAKYLWKKPKKEFADYEAEFRRLFPDLNWLFDCINEANRILDMDVNDDYSKMVLALLEQNDRQLNHIADYNKCLNPLMQSNDVSEDMKTALWQAKVMLDYCIKSFQEEIAND